MVNQKEKIKELREAFGEALLELGRTNKNVVVLDADVAHATFVNLFEKEFSERFFQLGIAEQNMMGAAAGFATCGLIPFATCFAAFASKRAHDQVSTSIAYPNLNVKIVGSYSGLSTPNTGATHQSIDDIATMRAMPNIRIVVPGDPVEVKKAVFAIVENDGPFYLRIAKSPAIAPIFNDNYNFEIGKAVILREGKDVALAGTGIMTSKCIEASEILKRQGIESTVLHVPTIKPIDKSKLVEVAKKTGFLITVENHNIIGGLGSAVCEVLGENYPCTVKRIGINDVFGSSGENVEILFEKYGLSSEAIAEAVRESISNKNK